MRTICMLTLLALALACMSPCALAESTQEVGEPFCILDGLTFASTPEEALAALGEGAEMQENEDEDVGKLALILKDGILFEGLDCGRIGLLFYDGALASASCYFSEDSLAGDEERLIEALAGRFGEGERYDDDRYAELGDLFGESRVRCVWTPEAQVRVTMTRFIREDYPWFCGVTFENLPVQELLDAAMQVE